MKNSFFSFFFIGTLMLCLLVGFSQKLYSQQSKQSKQVRQEEKQLVETFVNTYRLIRDHSIFTNHTSPKQLIFSAISGMINSLNDPYSSLLRGKNLEQFMKNMDNHYSGIGIYIVTNSRGILIVDVIPESPAWTIGLKANDIIIKVGKKSLVGKTFDEVRGLLLGPENSLVNITVLREKKQLNFNVKRKSIQARTVRSKILTQQINTKKIAYIRIISFAQNTAKEFQEALKFVKSQKAGGVVIDVRNNPGGLLTVVVEMVSYFISQDKVVSTQMVGNQNESINADVKISFPTFIPVVVLINQYSASASEIFAGALKDHHRAVIVGENSFGKFSVQKLYPIWKDKKENAALKLTIAKYFLPDGKSFDKVGISPHVYVTNQVVETNDPKKKSVKNVSGNLSDISMDPPLKKAVKILSDLGRYRQLINP